MCVIFALMRLSKFERTSEKKKRKKNTQHKGGDDGNNSAHAIGEQIQRLLAISATAVQNVNLSA